MMRLVECASFPHCPRCSCKDEPPKQSLAYIPSPWIYYKKKLPQQTYYGSDLSREHQNGLSPWLFSEHWQPGHVHHLSRTTHKCANISQDERLHYAIQVYLLYVYPITRETKLYIYIHKGNLINVKKVALNSTALAWYKLRVEANINK
jgi:hypothetical protein